jgi:hypothetical protein
VLTRKTFSAGRWLKRPPTLGLYAGGRTTASTETICAGTRSLAGAPPTNKDPFYPPAQIVCGPVVTKKKKPTINLCGEMADGIGHKSWSSSPTPTGEWRGLPHGRRPPPTLPQIWGFLDLMTQTIHDFLNLNCRFKCKYKILLNMCIIILIGYVSPQHRRLPSLLGTPLPTPMHAGSRHRRLADSGRRHYRNSQIIVVILELIEIYNNYCLLIVMDRSYLIFSEIRVYL